MSVRSSFGCSPERTQRRTVVRQNTARCRPAQPSAGFQHVAGGADMSREHGSLNQPRSSKPSSDDLSNSCLITTDQLIETEARRLVERFRVCSPARSQRAANRNEQGNLPEWRVNEWSLPLSNWSSVTVPFRRI